MLWYLHTPVGPRRHHLSLVETSMRKHIARCKAQTHRHDIIPLNPYWQSMNLYLSPCNVWCMLLGFYGLVARVKPIRIAPVRVANVTHCIKLINVTIKQILMHVVFIQCHTEKGHLILVTHGSRCVTFATRSCIVASTISYETLQDLGPVIEINNVNTWFSEICDTEIQKQQFG